MRTRTSILLLAARPPERADIVHGLSKRSGDCDPKPVDRA